jgi:1-acyl-sn-glycerol-3-phosphate acyltransferase
MKILGSRRTLRFLTKKEHFKALGLRQVMTWTGQIETDRQAGAGDALSRAVDILQCGSPMGLFPEGTRSRNQAPPFLQRGKTGIARLAATFPDLPVHPIAIKGSRDMLAPRSSKISLFAKVTMHIGEEVTWREWLLHPDGGAYDSEKIAVVVTLDEQDRMAELGGLYRRFTDQFIESIRALGAP